MTCYMFFFFFQAEDGIRDGHVTGVQTSALPIFGYDLENVLLLELVPLLNGYSNDKSTRFFEQVIEKVNQLPGVRSASIGSMGLLGPGLRIEGVRVDGENTTRGEGGGWINSVSPRYFETL